MEKLGKLTWRSYTAVEALLIISQIELMNKGKCIKAILNKNFKTFVMYIVALKVTEAANIAIYASKLA